LNKALKFALLDSKTETEIKSIEDFKKAQGVKVVSEAGDDIRPGTILGFFGGEIVNQDVSELGNMTGDFGIMRATDRSRLFLEPGIELRQNELIPFPNDNRHSIAEIKML
jgi:hypothetical protein